jgi:nitroreductase
MGCFDYFRVGLVLYFITIMNEKRQNPTLQVIFNRKSVREYTGQPVTKDILEILVKAGMSAPSARNLQLWNFIVITEKQRLCLLADGLPYAKMLYAAGAAIVVCGIPDLKDIELSDYWVQDCSAAAENILLAIEALSLGAVWTGVYPRKDRISWVKKVLSIPDPILPLNVIVIGHPVKEEKPKNKFNIDKIHWEKW